MDFTQTTPDYLRLRSDIFPAHIDNNAPAVYLPNDDDDEPALKRKKVLNVKNKNTVLFTRIRYQEVASSLKMLHCFI